MKTLAEFMAGLTWGGIGYPEYAGEGKSSPSAAEKAAQTRSGTMDATAGSNAAAQDSTLSQVEGSDVTQTGMYKRLLSLGQEGTTQAYNGARAKRASAARTAGFGWSSPVAQTDQATVDQSEARDIGNLPRETAQDVMPYSMQAAGMRGQNIGTYTGAGTSSMNTWADLEKARQTRQANMWNNIAKMGMSAATMGLTAGNVGGFASQP